MNKNHELKPCPWCGNDASISYPDKTVKISCGRDNCLSFVAICDDVNDSRVIEGLVREWNKYIDFEEQRKGR